MGIPHLTRHLLPHAETICLASAPHADLPTVQSVVIDGPSLVYHVYYRLLSWMNPNYDFLDIQPTCNEVSRGVVCFLLQLATSGVNVIKICFDGALPASKRSTRLSRIERSRSKLDQARRQTAPAPSGKGTQPSTASVQCRAEMPTSLISRQIWRSRNCPARWKNLPENPFMVSAVFEDLRGRWSVEVVSEVVGGVYSDDAIATATATGKGLSAVEFPWAERTVMVAGEADVECARVAGLAGSAILTADSDLLVHELGKGSVVFINSLQLIGGSGDDTLSGTVTGAGTGTAQDGVELEIRGQKINPSELCTRLGIPDIQRFAYELERNPQASFSELIRLVKECGDQDQDAAEYAVFLREYRDIDLHSPVADSLSALCIDPRVSELFWQFELPDTYSPSPDAEFNVYLGILLEDPSRKCAWEQARSYRSLGYALLQLSRSESDRPDCVQEFVRRGRRVVAEQVTLAGEKTVFSDLAILQKRLDLARSLFGGQGQGQGRSSADFWFLFALAEVYEDLAESASVPNARQLESFLSKGFLGKKGVEWEDVYLLARVQAVLYSLRMLGQFIRIVRTRYDVRDYGYILDDLPPLHDLMRPRGNIIRGFGDRESCRAVVHQIVKHYG